MRNYGIEILVGPTSKVTDPLSVERVVQEAAVFKIAILSSAEKATVTLGEGEARELYYCGLMALAEAMRDAVHKATGDPEKAVRWIPFPGSSRFEREGPDDRVDPAAPPA